MVMSGLLFPLSLYPVPLRREFHCKPLSRRVDQRAADLVRNMTPPYGNRTGPRGRVLINPALQAWLNVCLAPKATELLRGSK